MSEVERQILEIKKNVEQYAGEKVCGSVIQGSAEIGPATDPVAVARWAVGVMERLDASAGELRRTRIMRSCGRACLNRNNKSLGEGRERRLRYASEDDFLDAEVQSPQFGTRLERGRTTLIQHYTPRAYDPPMRCYCSLLWKLPDAERASATYCQCSRGFVEGYWEGVLGRPVEVEVLATALQGASECSFKIELSRPDRNR